MKLLRLLLGLLLFGYGLHAVADADEHGSGRVPLPKEIEGKGERCVEPEEVMRRDHMKFILHQRDETVHRGIRTSKYSLKECINCHVQPAADGSYPSIKSEDHFCTSCHTYASVSIDCFQCHAAQPTARPAANNGTAHAPATQWDDTRQAEMTRVLSEMLHSKSAKSDPSADRTK